ncbi:MAG: phosphopantothenoylcysteine decarboxylase domain-containing protein [Planctomycetota bacterium]|jgi:phosphopantothenoylcysteine synthetase/decarboxylase
MALTLAGKHILITSGPTRADIDAVRYVSNRSSGRLGCRIALEALRRGACVSLVAGAQSAVPLQADMPEDEWGRLRVLNVETVADLIETLEAELTCPEPPDAVLHSMAVLDYVPDAASPEKTPSGRDGWQIRLVRTPKVIRSVKEWAPGGYLVAFKLEVGVAEDQLCQAALASLHANRADLVVANDLAEIRDETHPALVIAPDGQILARPATKSEIACSLCDLLSEALD